MSTQNTPPGSSNHLLQAPTFNLDNQDIILSISERQQPVPQHHSILRSDVLSNELHLPYRLITDKQRLHDQRPNVVIVEMTDGHGAASKRDRKSHDIVPLREPCLFSFDGIPGVPLNIARIQRRNPCEGLCDADKPMFDDRSGPRATYLVRVSHIGIFLSLCTFKKTI